MARILLSEPREDTREMIRRMLERLGHGVTEVGLPAPGQLTDTDAVLVDPAGPVGTTLCQAARLVNPGLALICVSVAEPPGELAALGIAFDACLYKPFTSEELAGALERVLSRVQSA